MIESDAPPLRVVIGDLVKEVFGARHAMSETGFRQMLAARIRQISDGTAEMDSDRIS